jgi:hypothetical protein
MTTYEIAIEYEVKVDAYMTLQCCEVCCDSMRPCDRCDIKIPIPCAFYKTLYNKIREERIDHILGKDYELTDDMMKNHFMHEKYGIVKLEEEGIILQYNTDRVGNSEPKHSTKGRLLLCILFRIQGVDLIKEIGELAGEVIHSTFRHTYDANGGKFGIHSVKNDTEKPDIYDLFEFDMEVVVLDTPENIRWRIYQVI